MMTPRIEKTLAFLAKSFEGFSDRYRCEHSIRVAHVGAEIARAEGLDEEKLIIACLLHDIAYSVPHPEGYDWYEHGRDGAKIARPFLESLGMDSRDIDEICYGIAIHVDDKADFEAQRTLLALSVSDADNIDRFDMLRLYFSLYNAEIHNLSLDDRRAWLINSISRLQQFKDFTFATKSGRKMWLDNLDFQIAFQTRLLSQLENSTIPEEF